MHIMVQDYNITNRAEFEKKEIKLQVQATPGNGAMHKFDFPEGYAFIIESIKWNYGVMPGYQDAYGWPQSPMLITLEDLFDRAIEQPMEFSPPKILRGTRKLSVINTSSVPVTVFFVISGYAVALKGPISDKELIGYCNLDSSQRGMLALNEAAFDRLDSELQSMGMEGIRNALPGGQVVSINQLTTQVTAASQPNMLAETNQRPKALSTEEDKTVIQSQLLADLLLNQEKHGIDDVLVLKTLSSILATAGWRKN